MSPSHRRRTSIGARTCRLRRTGQSRGTTDIQEEQRQQQAAVARENHSDQPVTARQETSNELSFRDTMRSRNALYISFSEMICVPHAYSVRVTVWKGVGFSLILASPSWGPNSYKRNTPLGKLAQISSKLGTLKISGLLASSLTLDQWSFVFGTKTAPRC